MVAQGLRQPIIGNAAAQVMDVMNADIRGEPAQDRGQVVVRAAVQGVGVQVPVRVLFPGRLLELVLHVEQPHAERRGEQDDGKLDEQECPDADEPDQRRGEQRNREVGRHGAEPGLPPGAHQPERQPVLQQEQVGRTDAEHDQRMPVQAIADPSPQRPGAKLAHRQRVDIADAAAIEVSGSRVVDGVVVAPVVVGRHGQHATDAADPVIRQAVTEEGAVTAIVLDHEQPHHQPPCRHGEKQRDPISEVQAEPHQRPQGDKRHDRDRDLDAAAPIAGLAVARKVSRQELRLRRRCGGMRGVLAGLQSSAFLDPTTGAAAAADAALCDTPARSQFRGAERFSG
jgi:hypothetical protein